MKKPKQFLTIALSIALLISFCVSAQKASAETRQHKAYSTASSGVSGQITVTRQPQDCSVVVNGKAVFSVAAEGEGLSYQWQQLKNAEGSQWVSISSYEGCLTDTLIAPAYDGRDGYRYRCMITDSSGGRAFTDEAVMTLLPAVTIIKDTENVTAEIYGDAVFHVEAAGVGLTYQWQYYGPSSEKWLPVESGIFGKFSGENTDTFSIYALPQLESRYQIRCLVTDEGDNKVRSSPAVLKITVSSPATVAAEDFGANGGDTEDDRKTIQLALNFARSHATKSCPVTVTLASGTFRLYESLLIYSHTRFELSPETVLSYFGSGGSMLLGGDGTQANYNTLTDVVISGGLWKGNASSTGFQTEPIGFKSASNITLTGLRMEDSSDHFIMLTGVSGSLVKDCSFKDYVKIDSVDQFTKEAVHIDFMPFDDGTRFPSKNAVVENCTFDKVASGIGTHHHGYGSYETDIKVSGCTFSGLLYNCVNAYSMKELSVTGCSAENCGAFLSMCDSEGTFTSDTVQGSGPRCFSVQEDSSLTISECEVSGVGRVKVVDGEETPDEQKTVAILVKESSCNVENNEITDVLGIGILIRNGTAHSAITGNTVSVTTEQGIYVTGSGESTDITDNILTGSQGILSEYGESMITGNTISGCDNGITVWCGSSGITSNTIADSAECGIKINGTEKQNASAVIEKNTVTGSGSDDLRIGNYCSACAVRDNNTSGELNFTYSLKADIVASGNGKNPLPESPQVSCTASGTRISLSWNQSENDADYIVYRYDPLKEAIAKIAVTQGTEYALTGLADNTEYSFLVVCRDKTGKYSFYTYATNVVSAVTGVFEGEPVILSHPESVSAQAGDSVSFSVVADGNGLSYQWYYKKYGAADWTVWKGHSDSATTATVNLTWDGMEVRCAVTDAGGNTVYSDPAIITVPQPIEIITQPVNASIVLGDSLTVSLQATGSALRYQWYFMKADQTSFTEWKGHTHPTETCTPNDTWNGIQLYCIVTDRTGNTAQSDTVTVTITQELVITQQPVSQTIQLGSPVTVSLKAEGMGLKYQWYFMKPDQSSFSAWGGRVHSYETCTPNATWNGIQLYCIVTDSTGNTVQSDTVTVTITQELVITQQPVSQTIQLGSPVTVSLRAEGMGLKYQWYFMKADQTSFAEWKGHTRPTESCTPNATWNGIQLYCIVTDSTGNTVQSDTVTVTITQELVIIQQPVGQTIQLGSQVTVSLKAEGMGLKYQWYFMKPGQTSFTEWKGHTRPTESCTPNATWNGIQLYCIVTDGTGNTVQSDTVTVTVK